MAPRRCRKAGCAARVAAGGIYINAKAIAAQAARQPIISVDTKKKELIGNYKNGGTDYRPKGDPRRVKVHDFEDKELGRSCLMACTTLAPMQGG